MHCLTTYLVCESSWVLKPIFIQVWNNRWSQDQALEEQVNSQTGELEYTGRLRRRLILVLDCVVANDFTDKMADLINLQHYVIREKRLSEKEAIVIFFDIVRIIECLHQVRSLWLSLIRCRLNT